MLAKPWAQLLRHRADLGFAAALLLLVAAASWASYQRLFSSFATYDDEGYVMVSLRQFMAGGALYDEVYSQYGPAYYWLESIFHRATDWPVTHDTTRIKTLAVWMSVSLLAAGWLYRVTRSGVVAVIGLLFISFHLERLAMEPGHPQELCVLAVAACMFLATFIRNKPANMRVVAGMGLATGLCVMTKINVGLFLLLSISAALLFATRSGRLRNIALTGVLAAMVVLPIVIGRHELLDWHGYRLSVLLTIAIALTAWFCIRIEFKSMLELRHTFGFWGVASFVSAVIALATIAAGTSMAGLADGILLQHMSFVNIHYHDPPIHACAPLAAVIAVIFARRTLTGTKALRALQVVAMVLVMGAAIRHLVETFQPLYHGSQDVGQTGLLVSYFAAYVWIILLPVRKESSEQEQRSINETHFARLSLCLIAVLQPLIAYPVPGTQMAIGSLALVVALLTAIHDATESLRREGRLAVLASRGLVTGLVGLLLITVMSRDVFLWSKRAQMPSLDLVGASRLHLPAELAAREQWTVKQLRERADTFVCVPSGHNSLYLWSGIEPPTGLNATVWQDLLSDDQQRKIIDAINTRRRVCAVFERSEPQSLRAHGPLLDFIRENFEPVAEHGTTEIWTRRSTVSAVNVVSRHGTASGQTQVGKLGEPRAM